MKWPWSKPRDPAEGEDLVERVAKALAAYEGGAGWEWYAEERRDTFRAKARVAVAVIAGGPTEPRAPRSGPRP